MAKRYTGDIEIRMSCKPYVGWDGKRKLFYFATIAAPGHRGRGIISLREAGVDDAKEARSVESYDKAAGVFLEMSAGKYGIGKFAEVGDNGKIVMHRIQQAPCPVSIFREKKAARKKRKK